LKETKPDIVVTSLYRSNIISRIACKITGTKLIGTFVDDSYNIERRRTFKGIALFKYQYTWFLDRITSFIPYGWISNSTCIAENNAKKLGLSLSKIKVVYRGRNSSVFHEWKVPDLAEFKFVTIGRLYEKKGYPELIEAFYHVLKLYNNATLVIYGEGSYRKEMEKQIAFYELQDKVTLAGDFPNAWMKIYESHCFVFPSRFEGFSGALVEAMMTGIPIIASDIPMNLEAVEHRKTALVHRLKDVKDLTEKMKEMVSTYPSMINMGQMARKIAIEKFDIKIIASQYEDVLHEYINH
jgi:glycosyltransferase involved in cell wall biosynthesis